MPFFCTIVVVKGPLDQRFCGSVVQERHDPYHAQPLLNRFV